ncbi:MAG TPA: hypothetical protein VKS22_14825 [Candidatus Binataceae bacterium]|nr:hypothetical protein [Candidatus Binataceae bacterium]
MIADIAEVGFERGIEDEAVGAGKADVMGRAGAVNREAQSG